MKIVLMMDAGVNLLLGALLVVFPPAVIERLGIPAAGLAFYPSILGAVFIGIAIALVMEARPGSSGRPSGLGLGGAVSINLCGGVALGLWLVFGELDVPTRGFVVMWALVIVLVGLSLLEGLVIPRFRSRVNRGGPGVDHGSP